MQSSFKFNYLHGLRTQIRMKCLCRLLNCVQAIGTKLFTIQVGVMDEFDQHPAALVNERHCKQFFILVAITHATVGRINVKGS